MSEVPILNYDSGPTPINFAPLVLMVSSFVHDPLQSLPYHVKRVQGTCQYPPFWISGLDLHQRFVLC